MHTEDNVAILSVSAPGSAITGQLEMPRPGLSSATNTSVPGPPELPGDGPGWFTQMRAELEMRDERLSQPLTTGPCSTITADLDTADTQSSRFTSA